MTQPRPCRGTVLLQDPRGVAVLAKNHRITSDNTEPDGLRGADR